MLESKLIRVSKRGPMTGNYRFVCLEPIVQIINGFLVVCLDWEFMDSWPANES